MVCGGGGGKKNKTNKCKNRSIKTTNGRGSPGIIRRVKNGLREGWAVRLI